MLRYSLLVISRGWMYGMLWAIIFFIIALFSPCLFFFFPGKWPGRNFSVKNLFCSLITLDVLGILSSGLLDQAQLGLDNYFFFSQNWTELSSVSQMLLYLLFLPLSYICSFYCSIKNSILGILTLSTINSVNHLDSLKSSLYHISPNEKRAPEKLL